MPPIHPSELRCSAHPTDDTDFEALITEAQRSPLDTLYDEVRATKAAARRARTSDTTVGGEVIIHDPSGARPALLRAPITVR